MVVRFSPIPRFSHLHEVLDGAARLQRVIREAEESLLQPGLVESDREMLESALAASRERLERVHRLLTSSEGPAVQPQFEARSEDAPGLPVVSAGPGGPPTMSALPDLDDERLVLKDLESLGRSLKVDERAAVERRLFDPRANVRAAALRVLVLHWRLEAYADQAVWTLASDDEADCRRAAALSLGSLYEGTRDERVGRELTAAMARPEEEDEVRWACWYALHELDGRDPVQRPLPEPRFSPVPERGNDLLRRYSARA